MPFYDTTVSNSLIPDRSPIILRLVWIQVVCHYGDETQESISLLISHLLYTATTSYPDLSRRFLFDAPYKSACCLCDDWDPTRVNCTADCRSYNTFCDICKTTIQVMPGGTVLKKKGCGTMESCVRGFIDTQSRAECLAPDKTGSPQLPCTFCCKAPSDLKPQECLNNEENNYVNFTAKYTPVVTTTKAPPDNSVTSIGVPVQTGKCYTCSKPGCEEKIEECRSNEPLCMNVVAINGTTTTIKKSCASYAECYNDAYLQQRHSTICDMGGAMSSLGKSTICIYCCNTSSTGTPCNAGHKPSTSLQYTSPGLQVSSSTYTPASTVSMANTTTITLTTSASTDTSNTPVTSVSPTPPSTMSNTTPVHISSNTTMLPSSSATVPILNTTSIFSATPLSRENATTAVMTTAEMTTASLLTSTSNVSFLYPATITSSVSSTNSSPINTTTSVSKITGQSTSKVYASSSSSSSTAASNSTLTTAASNSILTTDASNSTLTTAARNSTLTTASTATHGTNSSVTSSPVSVTMTNVTSTLHFHSSHINVTTPPSTTRPVGPYRLPNVTTECVVCDGPVDICELSYVTAKCEPPNNYCINLLNNNRDGSRQVQRKCGNLDTCYREWYLGTSDVDRCMNFDPRYIQPLDFTCTFCCTTSNCNVPVVPLIKYLYNANGP